jgi:hypothetical protein
MELGGNIFLENFDEVESGKLIVVKKVVGNYTKNISEKAKNFKKITISLKKSSAFEIEAKVEADKEISSIAKEDNLFFALDKALSEILDKAA